MKKIASVLLLAILLITSDGNAEETKQAELSSCEIANAFSTLSIELPAEKILPNCFFVIPPDITDPALNWKGACDNNPDCLLIQSQLEYQSPEVLYEFEHPLLQTPLDAFKH